MTNNVVLHWVAFVICLVIPVLLKIPGWETVTLGSVLSALYLWATRYLPPVAGK